MKMLKYWLAVAVVVATNNLVAAEPNDKTMDAVSKFIDSKRSSEVQAKAANLSLAGDVRSYYKNISLKRNDVQMYGKDAAKAPMGGTVMDTLDNTESATSPLVDQVVPSNVFGVQFNMYTSYENGPSFADTWLSYDNAAGYNDVGSGSDDSISLKRAVIGYHVIQDGPQDLTVMVGRDDGFFDSKVQHRGNLDGLFVKNNNVFDGVGNFSVRGSMHLVDQSTDHWAFTTQLGLGNIADSNFSLRYSYNNFTTSGDNYIPVTSGGSVIGTTANDLYQGRQWKYQISELYASYDIGKEMLSFPVQVYAAYGLNHDAEERFANDSNKYNTFWYAGTSFGALEKANDWAFDLYYSKVEAQALPSFDISGDGRGNRTIGSSTSPTAVWAASSAASVNDRANFAGWTAQAGYNVTDELALALNFYSFSASTEDVGGNNDFRQFEAQVIYAF